MEKERKRPNSKTKLLFTFLSSLLSESEFWIREERNKKLIILVFFFYHLTSKWQKKISRRWPRMLSYISSSIHLYLQTTSRPGASKPPPLLLHRRVTHPTSSRTFSKTCSSSSNQDAIATPSLWSADRGTASRLRPDPRSSSATATPSLPRVSLAGSRASGRCSSKGSPGSPISTSCLLTGELGSRLGLP